MLSRHGGLVGARGSGAFVDCFLDILPVFALLFRSLRHRRRCRRRRTVCRIGRLVGLKAKPHSYCRVLLGFGWANDKLYGFGQ